MCIQAALLVWLFWASAALEFNAVEIVRENLTDTALPSSKQMPKGT